MTASGLSADDTIALHQLVHQYAHIVDDGDYDRLREIFTDDVEFDTSAFGNPPLRGIDPVIASYVGARHPVAHHVTTPVVTTDPDGTVRIRSKGPLVARWRPLGEQDLRRRRGEDARRLAHLEAGHRAPP
jgi:hypothetical protein